MAKLLNRLTGKVCVLLEDEAKFLEEANHAYKCGRGRHTHYQRNRAEELVNRGEARWVGGGKNKITFLNARTWQKVYARNPVGEVLCCNMQMVPGGASF